jgi:hypothetical protein
MALTESDITNNQLGTHLAPTWHKRKNTYPFDEVSVSFSVRSIKDLNLGPSD